MVYLLSKPFFRKGQILQILLSAIYTINPTTHNMVAKNVNDHEVIPFPRVLHSLLKQTISVFSLNSKQKENL